MCDAGEVRRYLKLGAQKGGENETNATYTARTHYPHVQPTMSCVSTQESASFYD